MTATLRSEGKIVLNVASSGIAALLLDRGRTAHSRFAIPINIFEDSMCSISADAFDRTMQDICRTENNEPSDQVFGGKVVVLGGDFRQILLVIQNGSRQDVVHVSLNSSELWQHCIVMKLTVNMRLKARKNSNEIRETKEFVDWILNIGNGKIGEKNDGESTIEFSEEMLIPDSENHVTIIQETYPDLIHNLWNPSFFPGKSNISANARNGLSTKVTRHLILTNTVNEAFDRTMQDICRTENNEPSDQVFGGKVVVLGGDFRQILLVIQMILNIGNGKIGEKNDGESTVEFSEEMLIPDFENHRQRTKWFINKSMLDQIPDKEKVYLSADTVSPADDPSEFVEDAYTPEFLNSIKMSGIPNHELALKVGAPVMCMRNIDQRAGLCNGTRLQITRMGVIEAKIIFKGNVGTEYTMESHNSYGGTSKTYLYKTMTATLRSEGKIVLNVASSGIAALLLDRGRTAHSRFAIPINIFEDSMCSISADDDLADLLRKTSLII
ncbi:ATP-dependent DNA helicase PIF1-like protein [Tanacetum coccineum]